MDTNIPALTPSAAKGSFTLKWSLFMAASAEHPAVPGKRDLSPLATSLHKFSLCDSESQEVDGSLEMCFPEVCVYDITGSSGSGTSHKASKSEVTISFPNVLCTTSRGVRKVETFSFIVYLHTNKQYPV